MVTQIVINRTANLVRFHWHGGCFNSAASAQTYPPGQSATLVYI